MSTRVGYTGGENAHATYRNHPGHAEAIEIVYDPSVTDYRALLEFFFQIHDPTTKNRQGNDVGTSYRSAIFYVDDDQKQVALDTIADVDASGLWPGKVVTEVTPAGDFWQAEPEHQDYLLNYPNGYTCHFPRAAGSFRGVRPEPIRSRVRRRGFRCGRGRIRRQPVEPGRNRRRMRCLPPRTADRRPLRGVADVRSGTPWTEKTPRWASR